MTLLWCLTRQRLRLALCIGVFSDPDGDVALAAFADAANFPVRLQTSLCVRHAWLLLDILRTTSNDENISVCRKGSAAERSRKLRQLAYPLLAEGIPITKVRIAANGEESAVNGVEPHIVHWIYDVNTVHGQTMTFEGILARL